MLLCAGMCVSGWRLGEGDGIRWTKEVDKVKLISQSFRFVHSVCRRFTTFSVDLLKKDITEYSNRTEATPALRRSERSIPPG